MDVKEFFQLSAGKWFSQRTSHHLAFKQSESGKSDLKIDMLPADDPGEYLGWGSRHLGRHNGVG